MSPSSSGRLPRERAGTLNKSEFRCRWRECAAEPLHSSAGFGLCWHDTKTRESLRREASAGFARSNPVFPSNSSHPSERKSENAAAPRIPNSSRKNTPLSLPGRILPRPPAHLPHVCRIQTHRSRARHRHGFERALDHPLGLFNSGKPS